MKISTLPILLGLVSVAHASTFEGPLVVIDTCLEKTVGDNNTALPTAATTVNYPYAVQVPKGFLNFDQKIFVLSFLRPTSALTRMEITISKISDANGVIIADFSTNPQTVVLGDSSETAVRRLKGDDASQQAPKRRLLSSRRSLEDDDVAPQNEDSRTIKFKGKSKTKSKSKTKNKSGSSGFGTKKVKSVKTPMPDRNGKMYLTKYGNSYGYKADSVSFNRKFGSVYSRPSWGYYGFGAIALASAPVLGYSMLFSRPYSSYYYYRQCHYTSCNNYYSQDTGSYDDIDQCSIADYGTFSADCNVYPETDFDRAELFSLGGVNLGMESGDVQFPLTLVIDNIVANCETLNVSSHQPRLYVALSSVENLDEMVTEAGASAATFSFTAVLLSAAVAVATVVY